MRKKASGKSGTVKGKAGRKPTDLAAKKVKGGDATSIKGGAVGFEKWIELTTLNSGLIRE